MSWIRYTIPLCLYGFFKEMKPSESFLTPFLNSTWKKFDTQTISDEIYPVSTYAYASFLLATLLLTDAVGYKLVILIEALAYLATRVLLCFARSLALMQGMQVAYGLASATEVAYFTYAYAAVDETQYQRVTSYTRAAVLTGKGVGDLLGQVLVSTQTASYMVLNYVSLANVSVSVLVVLFLPSVKQSYQTLDENEIQDVDPRPCDRVKYTLNFIKTSLKRIVQDKELLTWCVFMSLSYCCGLQVEDYAMNLWSDVNPAVVYNGAVFAAGTLLSAAFVFLLSRANAVLQQWMMVAAVISLVETGALVVMTSVHNIWVSYAAYVVFRCTFALTTAIASFQIACRLKTGGMAMVFGMITLAALILQTVLTLIVADKRGLDLSMVNQFIVYTCLTGITTLVFFFISIYRLFFHTPSENLTL